MIEVKGYSAGVYLCEAFRIGRFIEIGSRLGVVRGWGLGMESDC